MIKFKVLEKDVKKKLSHIEEQIKDISGVSFLYLFGSYARGEENNLSDIDIAYYISNAVKDKESVETKLYDRISSYLRTDEITFVCLNRAPLYLSRRIIVEGVILYERNQRERIDYIERFTKLYLDFLPFYKEVSDGYR